MTDVCPTCNGLREIGAGTYDDSVRDCPDCMTDTTKPTGDTIDDRLADIITNATASGYFTYGMSRTRNRDRKLEQLARVNGYTDKAFAVARELTAILAERPNRAVARGDSVTITMEDAMTIHYVVQDAALKNRTGNVRIGKAMCAMRQPALDKALAITTSLTTPTETTDPAMEGDDEH